MDEPAPDEEPGDEDEEQGADGQPMLPVEEQPETPPVQDSGETVVPGEDEPLGRGTHRGQFRPGPARGGVPRGGLL